MKRAICFATTAILTLSTAVPAMAAEVMATPNDTALAVNGISVNLGGAYNINGYNYFKLRDVAALLKYTGSEFAVGYDAEANSVKLTTNAAYTIVGGELHPISLTEKKAASVSKQKIILDGKETAMQAYLIDGNNYFQLRELGKNLGFEVAWDDTAKLINIITTEKTTEFVEYPVAEKEKEKTPVIKYEGKEISFEKNETPYVGEDGAVMVPVETVAEAIGAMAGYDPFLFDGEMISMSWTKESAPFVSDQNGDGIGDFYPEGYALVIKPNSRTALVTSETYMVYNPETKTEEKISEAFWLGGYEGYRELKAVPVMKNDVFYVALDDIADAFYKSFIVKVGDQTIFI